MMGAGEIECREEILGVSIEITPRSGTERPEGVGALASHGPEEGDVPPARIFDLLLTRLLGCKPSHGSGNDETILWGLSRLRLPTKHSRIDEGIEVTGKDGSKRSLFGLRCGPRDDNRRCCLPCEWT